MRTLPFFLILAACGPKVEPEAPVDPVQVLQAETPAEGEATSPESAWGEVPAEPVVTAPPPPTEEELLAKAESDLQQAAGLLTTRRESDTRRAIELLLELIQQGILRFVLAVEFLQPPLNFVYGIEVGSGLGTADLVAVSYTHLRAHET